MTIFNLRKIAALGCLLVVAGLAHADNTRTYEVTITNITKGQTFTPQLIATHDRHVEFFALGHPASAGVESMAESGSTAALTEEFMAHWYQVSEVKTIAGLLGPGEHVTTTIQARSRHRSLSLAAMLIPTNDTFVRLVGVSLPWRGSRTYVALAYDAGTELNDQNCNNIPGPTCMGVGPSPDGPNPGDEEYVYVSNGFHDLPDVSGAVILGPLNYDWRNPVAKLVVTRVH